MKPTDLAPDQFSAYPPLAKKTALNHLPLLKELPPSFVPFLLKEVIAFDWKFPAERAELLAQLTYLEAMKPADRDREMQPFAQLRLSPELESFDYVNLPGQFLERLSAHLWATSQMDTFRAASELYMSDFRKYFADPLPAVPRLAVALIGQNVNGDNYPLFRKLRREGVHFRRVIDANGFEDIVKLLEQRTAAQPQPYAHWFVDGGKSPVNHSEVALVSYDDLTPVRGALTSKMRQAFEAGTSPERLRTMLAEMTPASLGMTGSAANEVLDRFKVSLLTEGSGTQIYSTTFVQWTAREALRRAKPLTLVTRYAPRVREASMNELLDGTARRGTDPEGSLIDADMGAWYSWISLQRLTGADQSNFVVWFEGHGQAVAVGPAFTKGTEQTLPVTLAEIFSKIERARAA